MLALNFFAINGQIYHHIIGVLSIIW